MSGHNKWSKIKRSKGVLDVRRGKLFSTLSKEITVAAKAGGGNPDFNPRLRAAILSAKSNSMPADNIERAIKKGTGEIASASIDEIIYEGYGPDGIALILEAATDNKNRTAADLRTIFGKNNGNLAASGSVSYMFHRKGLLIVPAPLSSEEALLEVILEADADELFAEDDSFRIVSPPEKLYAIGDALKKAGFPPSELKLTFLPEISTTITEEETARKFLRLCDALEDNDDILQVHSNADISDALLALLQNS